MSEQELLPCPFCGQEPYGFESFEALNKLRSTQRVCGCGARGPIVQDGLSFAEATEKWNTRHLPQEVQEIKDKYHELLYQVQNVIPNESRHETAKRIIRQHENRDCGEAEQSTQGEVR